ncbi:MAG: tRNA (5-methylaminomethyl-2-thiouridine)(34)-methyltransferase MnmD [Anaerolineae bacterium]|nr:tRNA (5-methylaminomethyl-2-thiouridine)(34)-methyltransferase MnmD [Anaerolineae bacterium]
MASPFYDSFQPQSTGDGSDTLYSAAYDETFHSTFGALTETEHVFLRATGVAQHLAGGQPARVLEVGFGTGLNFWVTAHHSLMTGTPLDYVSLEKYLLPVATLARLNHGDLPAVAQEIRQAFLEWRANLPDPLPAAPLQWRFGDGIRLELVIGDAVTVPIPSRDYHAVYQDAFSPEKNPELWTQEFFARLFGLLRPGGKLATYSVKGEVRRRLAAVGFQVHKQPGPPGKREILVAVK